MVSKISRKKTHTTRREKDVPSKKVDPCEEKEITSRYQQKKINIFVSSTFRDMNAERDELTLRIFPALRKVCEDRRIFWSEVDLRWGIPEEKEKEEVLDICLKFIDDCRPYFIGMLGERYGWVEETTQDVIIRDYPWITDHKGKSITELEILHGVLNNPAMASHAYFYFRDPGYLNTLPEEQRSEFLECPTPEEITKYGVDEAERRADMRREQLNTLKETIRNRQLPVREDYCDPVQFGELVKEDLMRVIDSLAPPPKPLTEAERARTALDREEMAHETFATSRFGVYIPRQEYFDRLDAYAEGDAQSLVVLGDSGCGKSALLAHWAFKYRADHSDILVLFHFVGAYSESTDWAAMLRRFMGEFKRHFSLTQEIPVQEDALMAAFKNWLSIAAAHGRVVLVVDALNQLDDRNGAPDLVWLPPKIPENIRLVVSTLPGRPLVAIRERGWAEIVVKPLTLSERNTLITCYLRKYHRELEVLARMNLAKAEQAKNPLFLRELLEELRVHGEFGKLPSQIREYLTAKSVDVLFEMILSRYEHDYERDRPGLVKDTVSLLWAARRGLSKPELMDLLGIDGKPLPDAYWAPLYLAMEHALVEKEGRITFFHDYLRTAVEQCYLCSDETKRAVHLKIANYFAVQPDGLRRTEELPWQLAEAAEWERLVSLLTNPLFFQVVWEVLNYDVMRYWVLIEAGSAKRMIDAYQPVLKNPTDAPASFERQLCILLSETGHLDEAMILLKEAERICREVGNQDGLQVSLGNQANILYGRGDLDGAMALHKEAERIYRELGNIVDLAVSLNNQAIIQEFRGDPDGAMALHKETERICRKLGHKHGLAGSLGNQANILADNGDFDGAMAFYKETERIYRELGNMNGLAISLGNQAIILRDLGDLDEAMALHKEEERICRELGNKDGLATSLINQANILYDQRDLDRAMELYKETERIYQELGNKTGFADSLNNQANILRDRGDLDGAMALHKEAERICRKLGHKHGLAISLNNQAIILKDRGDLGGAMAFYKETERIYRELGNMNGLAISLGNQAIILADCQNIYCAALPLIEEACKIAESCGFEVLKQTLLPNLKKIQQKVQKSEQ